MHSSSLKLCALTWLVPLLLLQTVNDMSQISSGGRVSCAIRTASTGSGGKLDAIIVASGPVSGTFIFTVRKRAGGDVISQSGNFTVENATPTELKKATIDLDAGQAYDASLEVKWPNGSSSCSSSVG